MPSTLPVFDAALGVFVISDLLSIRGLLFKAGRSPAGLGSCGLSGSSPSQGNTPGALRRHNGPGRRRGERAESLARRLRAYILRMNMKTITQPQRLRLFQSVAFRQAEGRRHPTIVAHVPKSWVTQIGRMIKPGDALPG